MSTGSMRKTAPMLLAIVGVALFIALADNASFFSHTLAARQTDEHWLGIFVSMFLLVLSSLILVLSVSPGVKAFKLVAATLLIAGAGVSYFMNSYGIVVDVSMIRNVAETDIREASPLATPEALIYVLAFGVAPALIVGRLRLAGLSRMQSVGLRLGTIMVSICLLTGVIYFNFGPVSFFAHEHHELRMEINPIYPLYSLFRYFTRAGDRPPVKPIRLEAHRVSGETARGKPVLFVLVMGETARSDRFSYNGYERDTNAFTKHRDIVNFSQVTSCGTSTAESLPCIFSMFGRSEFSHTAFAKKETLLQLLGRLGVVVQWRDNSTGCKYICDPRSFVSVADESDPDLCHESVCVDEILLREGLSPAPEDSDKDHLIVLHQRGSHGPAYYTDTPRWAKVYLPECDLASLRSCDLSTINNAYDNTIRYTDYFLARVIDMLERESGRFAVAMLYVSDHGESLGEKGLYLHGLPYSIAPSEQIEVPMMFWASRDFYRRERLDRSCILDKSAEPITHDAVFHTMLPIFDVEAAAYDAGLDILLPCRMQGEGVSRGMSAAN